MGNRGQSLLEIVVVLGVTVVIVGGLTVTTVIGLRNSQFSKTQAQATKLAQRALEEVKVIKSQNLTVDWSPTVTKWNDLWDRNLTSDCLPAPVCNFILTVSTPFGLKYQSAPEALAGTDFKRQIMITDEPSYSFTQKRVTALITWSDTTGTHESRLVTILAK